MLLQPILRYQVNNFQRQAEEITPPLKLNIYPIWPEAREKALIGWPQLDTLSANALLWHCVLKGATFEESFGFPLWHIVNDNT